MWPQMHILGGGDSPKLQVHKMSSFRSRQFSSILSIKALQKWRRLLSSGSKFSRLHISMDDMNQCNRCMFCLSAKDGTSLCLLKCWNSSSLATQTTSLLHPLVFTVFTPSVLLNKDLGNQVKVVYINVNVH